MLLLRGIRWGAHRTVRDKESWRRRVCLFEGIERLGKGFPNKRVPGIVDRRWRFFWCFFQISFTEPQASVPQLRAMVLASMWRVHLGSCVRLGPIPVSRKWENAVLIFPSLVKTYLQNWEWGMGADLPSVTNSLDLGTRMLVFRPCLWPLPALWLQAPYWSLCASAPDTYERDNHRLTSWVVMRIR